MALGTKELEVGLERGQRKFGVVSEKESKKINDGGKRLMMEKEKFGGDKSTR